MPSKREQLLEIMEDAAKGETKATLRARIAELEAENERLRNMLNGYGKLDAELAIAERRIEALSRTGAVKVSYANSTAPNRPFTPAPSEGQQPVANEPATNHWPEAHEVADILAENKGFWRACSGCHETNEGHPTGPWSMILGCNLGHGCHECGGIGAVWDTTDYADMGDCLAQEFTRPSEQAVTEAMVEAAVQAVRQYTRDTLFIDEHRELVRAALKAAMEAGR